MKTVLEEIAVVAFVVAVYFVLPAAIVGGCRWVRRRAPETRFSVVSLVGFSLATCSALLALVSLIYAPAIGGFPYYDPRLLRFYRWGGILSDAGLILGIIGCWRRHSLRWYAPLCALGVSVFWGAAAMGE